MQRREAGDNRFVAVDAFGPGAADLGPLRVVSRQSLSLDRRERQRHAFRGMGDRR